MKKLFPKITKPKRITVAFISGILAVIAFIIYQQIYQIMPQATIYFLSDIETPTNQDTILFFSPHPDDESIAAGGYLHQADINGAKVDIVLVTDGNKHGLKDLRYSEFTKATETLGISEDNLTFLNYPDGKLDSQNQQVITERFVNILLTKKPTMVLFPNPKDTHKDHSTTGLRVIDALKKVNDSKIIDYEYLVHYRNFPEPKKYKPDMYLLPPQSLIQFDQEWKRFMLSPELEKDKKAAIDSYQSQLKLYFLNNLMFGSIRKNEIFTQVKI